MKKFIVFANTMKKIIVFGKHYEKNNSVFGKRPTISSALCSGFLLRVKKKTNWRSCDHPSIALNPSYATSKQTDKFQIPVNNKETMSSSVDVTQVHGKCS